MTNIILFTVRDVAGILKCTERHIRNLVARGRLRAKRYGRVVRFTEQEVLRFIDDSDGRWGKS